MCSCLPRAVSPAYSPGGIAGRALQRTLDASEGEWVDLCQNKGMQAGGRQGEALPVIHALSGRQ